MPHYGLGAASEDETVHADPGECLECLEEALSSTIGSQLQKQQYDGRRGYDSHIDIQGSNDRSNCIGEHYLGNASEPSEHIVNISVLARLRVREPDQRGLDVDFCGVDDFFESAAVGHLHNLIADEYRWLVHPPGEERPLLEHKGVVVELQERALFAFHAK